MKIYSISLIYLIIIFSFACNSDEGQKLTKRKWELTWQDEFVGNKNQAPDSNKWTYDIGQGQNGWGNGEYQYYTNSSENVALDGNGNLVIRAKKQSFGGANFTSGRIKTQGLFKQKYGRFEARIKTPYGPGIWPAFWMLGSNIDTVLWPECGEIDILELKGNQPSVIYSTVHGPGYSGGNSQIQSYSLLNKRFDTDFYLYAVEWDKNRIDFYLNDYLYHSISKNNIPGKWVFDQDFFIILNVAVGGSFVGFPTPSTPFPQEMTIDYVKVYKEVL